MKTAGMNLLGLNFASPRKMLPYGTNSTTGLGEVYEESKFFLMDEFALLRRQWSLLYPASTSFYLDSLVLGH